MALKRKHKSWKIKSAKSRYHASLSGTRKAPGVLPDTRGSKKKVSQEEENLSSCLT
jgi:hypothetical protein